MKKITACLLFLCAYAPLTLAQLPTGTILGTVKDSSGAVVAGAPVTARNADTGQTRNTVSDTEGSYRFDALPVGNYQVRVQQAGFKEAVHDGITLAVTQQAVVDFSLEVGSVQQQVEVTAAPSIVNTTSASVAGLVNETQMSDLPLNGRNYIQLALIQPGTSEFKLHNASGTGANLGTTGIFFSVNGAPARANAYLLDGTSLTVYGGATGASISGSTLGLDGIREFSIVTNTFTAEYGMVMGSQMLMVSKSGTNAFHGDAFEYYRGASLAARNYFDTSASSGNHPDGLPRRLPPYRRNNFGGALGGPIRKDKIFLFANYEGLKEYLGSTITSFTIPDGCRGAVNATVTIAQCPTLGSGLTSVSVSPVTGAWLPLFPHANLGTNQISWGFVQPTVEDYGQIRVDDTLSASDTLFGRYTIDNTTQLLASSFPGYPTGAISRGQFTTLSENHIFSPTLLNTARFSWSRSNLFTGLDFYKTGPGYSFVSGQPMGTVGITGVSGLSAGGLSSGNSQGLQNVFSYSDDLFATRGRHSLKFGTLINHFQIHALNGLFSLGSLSFASIGTFLEASPSTWTAIEQPEINYKTIHYDTLGFYAQDDFHATSRLTLNLGLRYEFNTNIVEIHGKQTAIRDIYRDAQPTPGLMMTDPSYLNFGPRLGFAWDPFGDGKTSIRGGMGLFYNIAGWVGIMHQTIRQAPYVNQFTVNNPGSFTLPLTFPTSQALTSRSASPYTYNMQQSKMVQYNFAIQRQLPSQMALTIAYIGSRGLNLMRFSEGNPVIPAGIPGTVVVGSSTGPGCVVPAAGYVPINIAQQSYIDGRANTCFLGNEGRRNPYWGTFESLIGASADSWYNGLQVSVEKRVTRGLQFQSNLTWSRALDTAQGQSGSDTAGVGAIMIEDPLHPGLDEGPAQFNIPVVFHTNVLYNFPNIKSDKLFAKALNGWWMSGILSLQSGYPFGTTFSTSRSKSFDGGNIGGQDRPDVLPGRNNRNITRGYTAGCTGVAGGQKLGTQKLYYDPCAFSIEPSGFYGNEGRNSFIGPNYKGLDFSLVKDTKAGFLGENGSVQFRAETFNILNRVNFFNPGLTIFAGNGPAINDVESPAAGAGQITKAFPSRQIQLALKVLF